MNLFVYGTLMDSEIMNHVSGSTFRSRKATLFQYVRKKVKGEVYPAITEKNGESVNGIVYFNVSSVAIDRLDKFEGPLYLRKEVVVTSEDGERVEAQTYVISANSTHQLSDEDWSYDNFIQNHKQIFQGGYCGYHKLEDS